MNKKYMYTDGKVTIMDEKGNTKSEEYYDNIDKVLVEENIIDTMVSEAERLEKEWKQYECIKSNKLFWLVPLLGSGVVSLMAPLLLMSMFTGHGLISLVNDTFYGTYILFLTSMVFPAGLVFGATLSTMEYLQYRIDKKKADAIISELDYLQEQIMMKRKTLKALQDNKSSENENVKARIVKVDDEIEIEKLRDKMEQYYELGYNIDKYYRYYEQGKLVNNLPDNIDYDIACKYIKQKKLVRKKRDI